MPVSRKLDQKISETFIQKALYHHTLLQNKIIWAHNIYLFNYELDFVAVHKTGSIYEYEIKRSRSDFKKDFLKDKHKLFYELTTKAINKINLSHVPNYFYFVCPVGLINPKELPVYAGLIFVYSNGVCKTVKKARRLHDMKKGLSKNILLKITKSLSNRFYGS